MKIKFILVIITLLFSSCQAKTEQKNNASTPSSRLDNIESGVNKTFKEIE